MRPNMSEDKKMADSSFVLTSIEGRPADESLKPRQYQKYIIIAVSGTLALTIILTAILVGMHLFTEAQKDIVRFSYSRDKNTKEEVTSDPNTNIVQYHVTTENLEVWVVNDFNRGIQTMKVHSQSSTNCYVALLNRTAATEPSDISPPPGDKHTNVTYILKYRSTNTPISDSTFLCQTARNKCNGISTYWLYPSCEGAATGSTGRKKRWFSESESCSCSIGFPIGPARVEFSLGHDL